MAMLPRMIAFTMEAKVSTRRIATFLEKDDIPSLAVSESAAKAGPVVEVRNSNFFWGLSWKQALKIHDNVGKAIANPAKILKDSSAPLRPLLNNVNFEIESGDLALVLGRTGSGKSALMAALFGDLPPVPLMDEPGAVPDGGVVHVKQSLAYAAQVPWIQNATVRDNILFGLPYDEKWYNAVMDACALRHDLKQLANGDASEIGEKGINLSGGQKQRISLARAVYRQSDIYMLDDCLSAVDPEVGEHIMSRCILGLLREKTVILVTNDSDLVQHADCVLIVEKENSTEDDEDEPADALGGNQGATVTFTRDIASLLTNGSYISKLSQAKMLATGKDSSAEAKPDGDDGAGEDEAGDKSAAANGGNDTSAPHASVQTDANKEAKVRYKWKECLHLRQFEPYDIIAIYC